MLLWLRRDEHDDGVYLGVYWVFALTALASATLAIGWGAIVGVPITSSKLHWDLLSYVMKYVHCYTRHILSADRAQDANESLRSYASRLASQPVCSRAEMQRRRLLTFSQIQRRHGAHRH